MIRLLFVCLATSLLIAESVSATSFLSSFESSVTFGPNDSEEVVNAKGGAKVTSGNATIYIGYRQVSGNDQDPIIASFTNGTQNWVITDYDTSPTDARGLGLGWNTENNRLYAVFSTDGGANSGDFTRFNDPGRMDNGWQRSYGSGGGAKVSVIYEIEPSTGGVLAGTYLISKLSSGNTNTISVTGLGWHQDQLVVYANTWFSPLNPDKSRMEHDGGGSPFLYRGIFSADLSALNSVETIGYNGVTEFSSLEETQTLELAGWVYVLWPYAYAIEDQRWYYFNEADTQWRVDLSTDQWGTLNQASGWQYFSGRYSYSAQLALWHWYDNNVQWVLDTSTETWYRF